MYQFHTKFQDSGTRFPDTRNLAPKLVSLYSQRSSCPAGVTFAEWYYAPLMPGVALLSARGIQFMANTVGRLAQRIRGDNGHLMPKIVSYGTAALLITAQDANAARFLLKVADHDGSTLIAGESEVANHEDWIEVHGFGSGVSRSETSADGSVTPVPVEQRDFVFRKRIDKSSPLFQRAILTGLLLPAVQVKYDDGDPGFQDVSSPLTVSLNRLPPTTGIRDTKDRVAQRDFSILTPTHLPVRGNRLKARVRTSARRGNRSSAAC